MALVRPSLHIRLGKRSLEYLFQVPAAMFGDARTVLRLIKSAELGSCARGDTTDNIPHETQALELFGMRHKRALRSGSRTDSNTSPCFSAGDKEVVCTKKVRSETDVLGEAGDGNSSHVRHHTHTDWRLL